MDIKFIVCILILILAVIAVFLPSHILNTDSCKRNWVVVLTILSMSAFIVNKNIIGLTFLIILILGISLNFIIHVFIPSNRQKEIEDGQ